MGAWTQTTLLAGALAVWGPRAAGQFDELEYIGRPCRRGSGARSAPGRRMAHDGAGCGPHGRSRATRHPDPSARRAGQGRHRGHGGGARLHRCAGVAPRRRN
eukprot:6643941-Alexandrium_andersonii.AAC.1